ncbi:mitochondria-eating protein isoform X9 [Pelodiscus sinensis]|uniref:mitochondria-eating protein isoform X9 n=1 Tax=Pelodiscus sinensis TaxID=13735 RepID=UPI000D720BC2|nr:mitochondria-eating protein isoform X8 [Pelodiscus sinensis]|eukprot:XP_025035722.1 mitochondria-eating protein isoform X8 [Pelodiscus sinensis]
MADSLRRLISNESCRILQEKLENWYKDYHINTCDQNLNRCCEIIEMNSMIQGQLFTILNQTAREGENFPCLQGGHYAGVETIKSRLLPWLGTCFSSTTSGRPFETSLSLIQESIERERQLREFASTRNHELQHLEKELNSTRLQLSLVQQELARSRSPSPRRCRSRSPSPLPLRSCSPGRARLTNAARHAHLVARFSEIYAQERLDAQALLMTYIEDLEMVQRIIYVAAVESFHAAKMAFRQFKMRVRKTLSLTYSGPESLEDTILDYIVRHEDLYDVQASVNEVIRAMNINPKISFPPEVDFIMISSLIRELCRVAFSMQTLVPPLDIAFGADGELFNENKYHRSYDSDFTAPLVVYHVWPPLIENDSVIVKGEAVSKRGALWSRRSRSKSRSRSRSMSPILSHSASPSRTLLPRSRSPSPIRSGSPSKWAHSVHNASWFSLSA